MKKNLSFFTLFIFTSILYGQSDGILWKISGNGLKKPSYLFGTIHYHCQPESINRPKVIKAIKASSKVALELNLGDIDLLIALYQISLKPSDKSLKLLLSASEYQLIDSACRYFLEDSLVIYDKKLPMDLLSQFIISEKFLGCKGLPIDFTIVQMAKTENKSTIGLETYEFQDSLLKSIPIDQQIKWLIEFCNNPKKAKQEFEALTDAYNSHKSESIYKAAIEASPEFEYLNEALLVQRNRNWVHILKQRMKSNSYFVAVGAAHLGGATGLIRLLKNDGYKLTPINF